MAPACGALSSGVRAHRVHPYTYSASLRAEHPSADLGYLSNLFGLPTEGGWVAGEPRRTPVGKALEGTRERSYWYAKLVEKWKHSTDLDLEGAIDEWLSRIEPFNEKLAEFFCSGGELNFFISIVGNGNLGLVLSPKLLGRLSMQRVELQLDIYPNE